MASPLDSKRVRAALGNGESSILQVYPALKSHRDRQGGGAPRNWPQGAEPIRSRPLRNTEASRLEIALAFPEESCIQPQNNSEQLMMVADVAERMRMSTA